MLYFFLGIISGIIISIAPFWTLSGAVEIYPEWQANIEAVTETEESSNPLIPGKIFNITTESDILLFSARGKFLKQINFSGHFVTVSNDSKYYVQYDKVGTHIELFNAQGDRFWRIKSMEYPYITASGKIILLMNGDHTAVRVFDVNGNPAGVQAINGSLCTGISLFNDTDYSGVGFLDGSYYFLDDMGKIITSGNAASNSMIKSMAISKGGKFAAVHFGNNKGDALRLIDVERNKIYSIPLMNISLTKTSLLVKDNGEIASFDYDRIIITDKDDIKSILKIPPKRYGLSSLGFSDKIYNACYADIDGRVQFFIFLEDGTVLFHKIFEESFMDSRILDNIIFLRGSSNLYCYSIDSPGI